MASETLVLVENNGLSQTRGTSVSDNTPAQAGFVPLLDSNGRLNNALLEDTITTAKALRWLDSNINRTISDGSNKNGPNGETFTDIKDAEIKWVEGNPVLFGFKDGKTVGVRVDSARNSDNLSNFPLGPRENDEANRVVRTDENGDTRARYFKSKAPVEGKDPEDVSYFTYINRQQDGYIRKISLDDYRKTINIDSFGGYTLDLSSLDVNTAYPIKFVNYTNCLITHDSSVKPFLFKFECQPGNANKNNTYISCTLTNSSVKNVKKIVCIKSSAGAYVYLRGGYKYNVINLNRDRLNRSEVIESAELDGSRNYHPENMDSELSDNFWTKFGDVEIDSTTPGSYMFDTHPAFPITGFGINIKHDSEDSPGISTKVAREDHTHAYVNIDHEANKIVGFGNNKAYDGTSFKVARADHTHYYDVNSRQLKPFEETDNFIQYGNNRQMVFKTDGDQAFVGTVSASAFVWLFNGDTDNDRLMYLTKDGDLYPKRCFNAVYADLAECFESSNPEDSKNWTNRIVEIDKDGKVKLASLESKRCVGVVSDSYGMILNGAEEEIKSGIKIPVAMSGTVYVLREKTCKEALAEVGDLVCSGKDGFARVTTNRTISVGKILEIYDDKYRILVHN